MQLRDRANLLDLERAARLVSEYVEGVEQTAFLQDRRTQHAILYLLLIMGEATKRLSQEFRDRYPTFPWSDLAKTRDFLIHQYDKTDPAEVWKITQTRIPTVLAAIAELEDEAQLREPMQESQHEDGAQS